MSPRIIDFTKFSPEAAVLKHLDQEARRQRQRRRQEALSWVRALAEAAEGLLDDPLDDFYHEQMGRVLRRVNEALEQGWLK